MTGLCGLLFTSSTGAAFILIPSAASSSPTMRPTFSASCSEPAAPSAMADGSGVTPSLMRTTRPPSWSMEMKSGQPAPTRPRQLLQIGSEPLHLRRRYYVFSKEHDAADVVLPNERGRLGSRLGTGHSHHDHLSDLLLKRQPLFRQPARPPVSYAVHPLIAPLVKPAIICRWKMRNKMTIGIADNDAAAIWCT